LRSLTLTTTLIIINVNLNSPTDFRFPDSAANQDNKREHEKNDEAHAQALQHNSNSTTDPSSQAISANSDNSGVAPHVPQPRSLTVHSEQERSSDRQQHPPFVALSRDIEAHLQTDRQQRTDRQHWSDRQHNQLEGFPEADVGDRTEYGLNVREEMSLKQAVTVGRPSMGDEIETDRQHIGDVIEDGSKMKLEAILGLTVGLTPGLPSSFIFFNSHFVRTLHFRSPNPNPNLNLNPNHHPDFNPYMQNRRPWRPRQKRRKKQLAS